MRAFITGSADGLGLELGRRLAATGHEVVLHGRDGRRAAEARAAIPEALVSGRLLHHRQVKRPAAEAEDRARQDELLEVAHRVSGVSLPPA
jgi:NAD(P)-dependent dehydrogenase (short-subunit alcohol dehydrogenase family)